MKKTLLAAALLMPLAAHAELSISPYGTGQALYLPYYTVEDGQATLISLSNQRDQPKAVRISAVEARNGQPVLGFNIYLGPRDSWNAVITSSGGEFSPAKILTSDDSCTVPDISAEGQPFVNLAYAYAFDSDDGGPYSLDRTRTGAIELIEMGVPNGALGVAVREFDCDELVDAFTPHDGVWSIDPNTDMGSPDGGLTASSDIVDVANGLVFNVPAVAIDGFAATPHHEDPGSALPRITTPVAGEGADFAVRLADGSTVAVAADRGPDAVSALFMVGALLGDVHNEVALGASTDWIVSFPTKHAYVFDVPGGLVGDDGAAVAPFQAAFANSQACEPVLAQAYAMDGEVFPPDIVVGKPPPSILPAALRAQVQRIPAPTAASLQTGRGQLKFANIANRPALVLGSGSAARSLQGLPALGFRLSRFINGHAQPGVLANYTVSERLRATPPTPSTTVGSP